LKCKKETNKKHYQKHRAYYIQKAKNRHKQLVEKLWRIKAEKGCKLCPERHPGCLHFHHRDPSKKLFWIGDRARARKWSDIKKEIKKCDVLCANCHSKLHFKQRFQWSE
jgi:hypothetical protein